MPSGSETIAPPQWFKRAAGAVRPLMEWCTSLSRGPGSRGALLGERVNEAITKVSKTTAGQQAETVTMWSFLLAGGAAQDQKGKRWLPYP